MQSSFLQTPPPTGRSRWTNFSCILHWTEQPHPPHLPSHLPWNSDHLFPQELSKFELSNATALTIYFNFFSLKNCKEPIMSKITVSQIDYGILTLCDY